MFNVGPQEMLVLLLVGVIVFGPDKLPAIAKQAAQMIRALRDLSDNARKQISELSPELGEQLGDLNALRKKGLGGLSASSALQKMIFDGDDDPLGMKDDSTRLKAAARDDDSPLSLAKQVDPSAVAGAAKPIPEMPPVPAPVLDKPLPAAAPVAENAVHLIPEGPSPIEAPAVQSAAASAAAMQPEAGQLYEPELTRAPMQQRRSVASAVEDAT